MTPKKQSKINRQKYEAITSPGALEMLIDFLRNEYQFHYNQDSMPKDEIMYSRVANIAARLKVQYMNNITPVEKDVKQIDFRNSNRGN